MDLTSVFSEPALKVLFLFDFIPFAFKLNLLNLYLLPFQKTSFKQVHVLHPCRFHSEAQVCVLFVA